LSLFGVGEQGFGAAKSPVLAAVRLDGLAAEFFHALADRREIVVGAGPSHIASLNWAGAGAVQPDAAKSD
jgi:hypothetical protein